MYNTDVLISHYHVMCSVIEVRMCLLENNFNFFEKCVSNKKCAFRDRLCPSPMLSICRAEVGVVAAEYSNRPTQAECDDRRRQ